MALAERNQEVQALTSSMAAFRPDLDGIVDLIIVGTHYTGGNTALAANTKSAAEILAGLNREWSVQSWTTYSASVFIYSRIW